MRRRRINFDSDERLIFKVRRHWFILTLEVVGILIIAIVPLVMFEVMIAFIGTYLGDMGHQVNTIFMAIYSAWLVIMWMALFNVWTNYYLDTWVLTNKKLIASDHVGLFNRSVATFRLERLQDVIANTRGLLPTLLKYGRLHIQTAGEEGNFEVRGIPNPEKLKAAILEVAGKASREMYGGSTENHSPLK